MKKTIFDKIVVGFVLLVIVIFSVLALYTVNMTQSKLLSNTEQNLKTESKLIISTTVTDYMNGLIDKDTFYQKLDEHAADMDAEIWLSTANGEIIYCSNSESPAAKDMMITDFYDRTDIYSQTVKTGTLNGCFSAKTLSLSTPVYQDKSYAGLLSIHLSLQFIKDIAQKTFASTYMPFLVIVVLSLIALMLITNSTLKPIREIIATSKQYATGNFNARIDVHTDNEFGELARYMEEMADELSRSNEYRKSFISNISHDFRSPLTSIKGYIEAMIDGTIPPDKHEKYLQIVLNETKRLTKLTQGLLELNNFDSFDLQLDKSNFDIKSIILPLKVVVRTKAFICMQSSIPTIPLSTQIVQESSRLSTIWLTMRSNSPQKADRLQFRSQKNPIRSLSVSRMKVSEFHRNRSRKYLTVSIKRIQAAERIRPEPVSDLPSQKRSSRRMVRISPSTVRSAKEVNSFSPSLCRRKCKFRSKPCM